MSTFNMVVAQFTTAATHYSAAIQPYALRLFFALLVIDVLVTSIQFFIDQDDAPHYIGRLVRQVLSGGFIYLMIVNAFPWMSAVLQSFSRIGSAATGLPNLNPQTVLSIGGSMAETLFNTPASASFAPNLELAIVESVSAFFVLLSFVIAAAALMLTLIESYLIVGGAVLLLGFGGSRWTASIAEGYFAYVIRVGTRLLFFYLVLGIGVQIATQWQNALTAACSPVPAALPWYATYGVPPKMIMTTVCSNAIPVRTMLDLAALSIVFLIVTLAVPYTAANIVGGTVGLALSHAFEAAYITQTVVRPIASTLQAGFSRTQFGGRSSSEDHVNDQTILGQFSAQTRLLADSALPQSRPFSPSNSSPNTSLGSSRATARRPANGATSRSSEATSRVTGPMS